MSQNISILIPTYNRKKFLPFIVRNIMSQDYPLDKLEVVIDDDGEIPLLQDPNYFQIHIYPITLKYLRSNVRKTIGGKRNNLIKQASHKVVVFMDDDDLYHSTYLSHSYKILKDTKSGCVGSASMMFLYPPYDNESLRLLNCGDNKNLIHEATIMMTKKWYKSSNKFEATSKAEGCKLFSGGVNKVALTDISKCMIAICHDSNTIDKTKFLENSSKIDYIKIGSEVRELICNTIRN